MNKWDDYAVGSRARHFASWCEDYLVQSVDQFANQPLALEDWQMTIMGEALATADETGAAPYWRSAVILLPRKNGKTTMLAAYALYRLFTDETQPEILLAAASDKQAGRLFDTCVEFIRRSPELMDRAVLREYIGEISRVDGGGKILRIAASGDAAHGFSPSLVILDEIHAWTKPSHRKLWAALTTAGGARVDTQVFSITTAGDANQRDASILGKLLDRNEAIGELERVDGLTISRNHDARTLVYNYSAPTRDPSDVAAMKLANPASWITEEYLSRQASNPELTAEEVLQFHGCVWVAGSQAWIPADWWNAAIERDVQIPLGAQVAIGIDVGIVHDATACVMAWKRPDDEKVVLEAKIWTPSPGRNVDLADVEQWIRHVNDNYQISCWYDPRFFERSAQVLDSENILMVTMPQNSATMADAYQMFYSMIGEGQIVHAGDDAEFASMVLNAGAIKTDRGWKVSKIKQRSRIDALVAGVMATYGAVLQTDSSQVPGFYRV